MPRFRSTRRLAEPRCFALLVTLAIVWLWASLTWFEVVVSE